MAVKIKGQDWDDVSYGWEDKRLRLRECKFTT
jgi:hypothetical protein